MNPMAALGPDGPPGDAFVWIAGIGGAAMILMWAFLTFLNHRDRKRTSDIRSRGNRMGKSWAKGTTTRRLIAIK